MLCDIFDHRVITYTPNFTRQLWVKFEEQNNKLYVIQQIFIKGRKYSPYSKPVKMGNWFLMIIFIQFDKFECIHHDNSATS